MNNVFKLFLIINLLLLPAFVNTVDGSPALRNGLLNQTQIKPLRLSVKQWREDLQFLVQALEQTHPNPYKLISREHFYQEVSQLSKDIPKLSDENIIVRLMQLVALIKDGHTMVKPYDPLGFNHWFPIRFYWFSDGLFVTAAAPEYKELIGAEVTRIGNFPAAQAAFKSASVQPLENEFAEKERIQYLSNAIVDFELGITNNRNQLPISYKSADGNIKQISVSAIQTEKYTSDNWMYHGEMYAPPGTDTITAFKDLPAKEYRTARTDLPLHLRERLPYWYTLLDDRKTLYMQFNFVENWGDESFADFYKRMFAEADRLQVGKFILDIRYNSGGDGSILLPFVHEIIKRDYLNQSGKIFTITGRKTFSAAVLLAGLMNENTKTIFVGEPMGAPLNSYGDNGQTLLPNSKLYVEISKIYHQMSTSDDTSRYLSIDIPAVFDSKSYFAGRDVALEAINRSLPLKSIPDLFLSNKDSQPALAEYTRRLNLYRNVKWWRPFSEFEMNKAGYELLRNKRIDDAITAFDLNTKHYPQSWNTWDSLAEAYMAKDNKKKAIEFYEQSLKINPLNLTAVKRIAGMQKGN